MKVVGLCGGSGSGKGLVCSFFSDLNIECIDTDKVYHSIISHDSECTEELVSRFGESIAAHPGINRTRLREIAFLSEENLRALNEITHRHILCHVRLIIDKIKGDNRARGIIIDAPLLFESRFNEECDATIAVVSDDNIRIERIMARDNITRRVAVERISSQLSNEQLIERCDYVIENNSNQQELKHRVYELAKNIFDI